MLCLSAQWIPKLFCIVFVPHAPILGIQCFQPLQIPIDFPSDTEFYVTWPKDAGSSSNCESNSNVH